MALHAIINEYCQLDDSYEYKSSSQERMLGLSLSSVHPEPPSALSLPTLPIVHLADGSSLSEACRSPRISARSLTGTHKGYLGQASTQGLPSREANGFTSQSLTVEHQSLRAGSPLTPKSNARAATKAFSDAVAGLNLQDLQAQVQGTTAVANMSHGSTAAGWSDNNLVSEYLTGSAAVTNEVAVSVGQFDGLLEDFQIRENYSLLQEKFTMMENAARAEINELRTRLLEAHSKLAEIGAVSAVSGCTEKLVARQACEDEMYMSKQNLLVARAEVTHQYEEKLRRANRFGPPDRLVQRLLHRRLQLTQLHCLLVWRSVATLRPEQQDLGELEIEIRCWDKARRLGRLGFSARRIFFAWRGFSSDQAKGRLQRLIDIAHDSWSACQRTVDRAIDKQRHITISAVAARCFIEWLRRYQRSRELARLWRFLGKERKLLRLCFAGLLRAVSAMRRDRIEAMQDMRTSGSSMALWNDRIQKLEQAYTSGQAMRN